MSWATRRKSLFTLGTIVFILLIVGIPGYFILNEPPTCSDGKKNQDEVGIDRGGPCSILDITQVTPHTVLWARSFEVIPGVYSAVSYIDNPNINAGSDAVPYTLKLFDDAGILIAERKNITFITPNSINPIFEGGIATGERKPTKAFLAFDETPAWEIRDSLAQNISVRNQLLQNEESAPKVTAEVVNTGVDSLGDVEVVVVLFNRKDNAIAASKTIIGHLGVGASEPVVFTWPKSFDVPVSRFEILPRIPHQ
ncbi:MAG: hypothetical protein QF858_01815 [Candidatus Pacebacteria bacterium]|jgi:hypothetical protein|nr:hypothetical protein [bacterium]MDP6527598.1 hypothetical protein [Candidatus Paceibacterota bacterium]MDP6659548.1 hypothetical protein [Candidatus Paceibacterota bacterium]|tara:strand:- start:7935 stop:8693 length:759 start_codon:yes stop_codon:yes gene_type:complete